MLPLHSLAAVLPLYLIVVELALAVIWLYTRRPQFVPATSPAMQAAPVAPVPRSSRIMRYDVIKIDASLRGSGAAIHRAEQNGYTIIEKHDTVITMVKPNGRPVGEGYR